MSTKTNSRSTRGAERWSNPDVWERDVAAFLASEHLERRAPDPSDRPTVTPDVTLVRAAPRPGERMVVGFPALVLFEVDDPSGYGFRLVGLLENGVARVWELPGYTFDEAHIISRTWSEYPEILLGLPIRPGTP